MEETLEPLFRYFIQDRTQFETFGDFCDRVGLDAINNFVETYQLVNVKP